MGKGKLRQTASTIIALVLTLVTTAFAEDFEPQYVGGYPTEETAAAMFDEYDYQAATQFYVWAYAYLNSLGMDKGFARLGGGERWFYVIDKLMQPQHVVMTANTEVVYTWSRLVDVSKGPVVFEIPPRGRGHFYDMGMRAYVDTGDVGPDQGRGGNTWWSPRTMRERSQRAISWCGQSIPIKSFLRTGRSPGRKEAWKRQSNSPGR
jgi:hypothetical protein